MKRYFFLITVVAGIIACKKDHDMLGPEITITSPTAGQMINAGDSVLLDVLVTDVDLHEAVFTVRNAADTSIAYFTDGMHSHDSDLHYVNKFKVPAVLAHTDVILFVFAEDHVGHESDKSVTFAFMP